MYKNHQNMVVIKQIIFYIECNSPACRIQQLLSCTCFRFVYLGDIIYLLHGVFGLV
jgi:hypothetical protein